YAAEFTGEKNWLTEGDGFEPLAKRASPVEREVPGGEKGCSKASFILRGTEGSNSFRSSGESGEIHERACGAEVWTHPVHRKSAMKLVPRPGFVSIDRSASGDPGADEIKRSDF